MSSTPATRGASVSAARRRALVTGASSGIGAATARRLAREGYAVALLARDRARLDVLAGEIVRDGGLALVLPCDLRDPEEIARAFAAVERELGALDLVVHAAGIGCRARVEELDDALVRDVLDTNVASAFHVARLALPLLRRGDRPVLVLVASVVARRGVPGQALYSASKAAVVSLAEGLRLEWARDGVEVCVLSPALTRTEIFARQANPSRLPDPDLSDAMEPDEVARRVLALDRRPVPEVVLRASWRLLALWSLLAPRSADRALARRLGWPVDRSDDARR